MSSEISRRSAIKIFKALGEPTRMRIVELLYKRKEMSCTEIGEYLDSSSSTLSHHLKQLQECSLLELVRKEGTFHFYRLNKNVLHAHVVLSL